MNLETMTRDERSLLTFLETCLVDKRGKVRTVHMNQDDMEIAKGWDKKGFIQFKRLPASEVFAEKNQRSPLPTFTHWVRFSDKAWALAHQERRARAVRNGSGGFEENQ